MRQGQLLIRLVVFCCVALDPTGGGTGIALGVAIGLVISVGMGAKGKKSRVPEDETNLV